MNTNRHDQVLRIAALVSNEKQNNSTLVPVT